MLNVLLSGYLIRTVGLLGFVLTHLPSTDLVLFFLILDQGLNFLMSSLAFIPVVCTFQLEAKKPVYTGLCCLVDKLL